MLGALELGGTKIICAIGTGHRNILRSIQIETTTPDKNADQILNFFSSCNQQYDAVEVFGIATFGPVEINPAANNYGTILKTPKPGWTNYSLRQDLIKIFDVPVVVNTDVNSALLAETEMGAAVGISNAIYVTIGTGVGAGIMVNGDLVTGFLHPEVGHMRVPTYGVKGTCPFHGNCLEGLVSGPAIAERAGMAAHLLHQEDPLWTDIALNIADLCINLTTTLAPYRIILGGGVMSKNGLLAKVQAAFTARIANYLPIDSRVNGVEKLIVLPKLDSDSGLIGAFLLAEKI